MDDDGPPEKIASDYVELASLLLMFALGAPLNLAAVTQLAEKPTYTRLDILKRHLNYSDLLVLFIYVPSRACWLATYDWRGGDFLCRLIKFLHTFAFQVSSNVIVVIAVDRLLTVVSGAHRQAEVAQRRMRLMLTVAWGVALVISSPQFIVWRSYLAFTKPVAWSQCMQIWEIARAEYFRGAQQQQQQHQSKAVGIAGTLLSNGTSTETTSATTTTPMATMTRSINMNELMHEENVYTLVHMLLIFWIPAIIIFLCYAVITCWVFVNSKPAASYHNNQRSRSSGGLAAELGGIGARLLGSVRPAPDGAIANGTGAAGRGGSRRSVVTRFRLDSFGSGKKRFREGPGKGEDDGEQNPNQQPSQRGPLVAMSSNGGCCGKAGGGPIHIECQSSVGTTTNDDSTATRTTTLMMLGSGSGGSDGTEALLPGALNRPKILINDDQNNEGRESPVPLGPLPSNGTTALTTANGSTAKGAGGTRLGVQTMGANGNVTPRPSASSVVPSPALRSSQSSSCSAKANRRKAIRVSFLLVAGYLACWFPYNALSLIQFVDPQAFAQHANKLYCLHVFIVFNSVINPYLYGIFGNSLSLCKRHRRDS